MPVMPNLGLPSIVDNIEKINAQLLSNNSDEKHKPCSPRQLRGETSIPKPVPVRISCDREHHPNLLKYYHADCLRVSRATEPESNRHILRKTNNTYTSLNNEVPTPSVQEDYSEEQNQNPNTVASLRFSIRIPLKQPHKVSVDYENIEPSNHESEPTSTAEQFETYSLHSSPVDGSIIQLNTKINVKKSLQRPYNVVNEKSTSQSENVKSDICENTTSQGINTSVVMNNKSNVDRHKTCYKKVECNDDNAKCSLFLRHTLSQLIKREYFEKPTLQYVQTPRAETTSFENEATTRNTGDKEMGHYLEQSERRPTLRLDRCKSILPDTCFNDKPSSNDTKEHYSPSGLSFNDDWSVTDKSLYSTDKKRDDCVTEQENDIILLTPQTLIDKNMNDKSKEKNSNTAALSNPNMQFEQGDEDRSKESNNQTPCKLKELRKKTHRHSHKSQDCHCKVDQPAEESEWKLDYITDIPRLNHSILSVVPVPPTILNDCTIRNMAFLKSIKNNNVRKNEITNKPLNYMQVINSPIILPCYATKNNVMNSCTNTYKNYGKWSDKKLHSKYSSLEQQLSSKLRDSKEPKLLTDNTSVFDDRLDCNLGGQILLISPEDEKLSKKTIEMLSATSSTDYIPTDCAPVALVTLFTSESIINPYGIESSFTPSSNIEHYGETNLDETNTSTTTIRTTYLKPHFGHGKQNSVTSLCNDIGLDVRNVMEHATQEIQDHILPSKRPIRTKTSLSSPVPNLCSGSIIHSHDESVSGPVLNNTRKVKANADSNLNKSLKTSNPLKSKCAVDSQIAKTNLSYNNKNKPNRKLSIGRNKIRTRSLSKKKETDQTLKTKVPQKPTPLETKSYPGKAVSIKKNSLKSEINKCPKLIVENVVINKKCSKPIEMLNVKKRIIPNLHSNKKCTTEKEIECLQDKVLPSNHESKIKVRKTILEINKKNTTVPKSEHDKTFMPKPKVVLKRFMLKPKVEAKRFMQNLKSEDKTCKSDLRSEVKTCKSDLRSEVKTCKSDLRSEDKTCKSDLRSEDKTCKSDLRSEVKTCKSDLKSEDKTCKSETVITFELETKTEDVNTFEPNWSMLANTINELQMICKDHTLANSTGNTHDDADANSLETASILAAQACVDTLKKQLGI